MFGELTEFDCFLYGFEVFEANPSKIQAFPLYATTQKNGETSVNENAVCFIKESLTM